MIVGVDLGQPRDFTAPSVLEPRADDYHLCHVERQRLGTADLAIVARICQASTNKGISPGTNTAASGL